MILIDSTFLSDAGIVAGDTGSTNEYTFHYGLEMTDRTVYDIYNYFKEVVVNGVNHGDEYNYYKAIGDFYSEPIYDEYTFFQNVTFDGVNAVGSKYEYYLQVGILIGAFDPADLANTQFYSDPTIQSSINSKLAQSLDGSIDALNSDSLLTDLSATTTGIWAGWVKPVDATPTLTSGIVSFADTDADTFMTIRMLAIGTCNVRFKKSGVNQCVLTTDAAVFSDNTWTHVTLVQDGVSPVLYINGVAVAQTFTVTTDKTIWFNSASMSGIDNGRIGTENINSVGNAQFFGGDFDEWGIWDNDSSVTASSLYNSGSGKTYTDLTTAEKVGLSGYYTMNDLDDSTANANDLVAIGTPIKVIGKVQTIAISGESIYTVGDLAPSSNDGIQATLINQPIWNETHITYATNDFINIDDVLADITTSTGGTFGCWVKMVDSTPAVNETLCSFGDTNAIRYLIFYVTPAGKLRLDCVESGTQWSLETDAIAFSSGVWSHAAIVQDGVSPVLYVDNVAVPQTFTTSVDKTYWFNSFNPLALDNGRIGCFNFNNGGDSLFINGDIQQFYISTDVKDTDTRTNIYNHNQPS